MAGRRADLDGAGLYRRVMELAEKYRRPGMRFEQYDAKPTARCSMMNGRRSTKNTTSSSALVSTARLSC